MSWAELRFSVQRYWFGAYDHRPLALARLTFGFALLIGVLDTGPIVNDLLSDNGAFPRSVLLGMVRPDRFSIFDAAGPLWVTWVFWLVTLTACLCFFVGYHTRLANLVAFIFVTGLHERNLQSVDGADEVFRVMLFWFLLVPSGDRYSVDAVRQQVTGEPAPPRPASAFFFRLLQLQFAWIYFDSFLCKLTGATWRNGEALHYALGLGHSFTRPLGLIFNQSAWLVVPGTYFTLFIEAGFLFAVFVPWGQPWLKLGALAGGLAMHSGIGLLMAVGDFTFLMPLLYALYLEPAWIDRGLKRLASWLARDQVEVLYDGLCPLCRRSVAIIKAMDVAEQLTYQDFRSLNLAAYSPAITAEALERRIHVVSRDRRGQLRPAEAGYRAIARLARQLPALAPLGWLASLPGLARLGGPVYDWIADHRQTGHRCDDVNCAVPLPAPKRPWLYWPELPKRLLRMAAHVVGAVTLISVMWFSTPKSVIRTLPLPWTDHYQQRIYLTLTVPDLPVWLFHGIQFVELWQAWNMFAPDPVSTDKWLKGVGQLKDGTEVDPLRDDGGPLPPLGPGVIFSRWTKFTENMAYADENSLRALGGFLCRRWNRASHPARAPLKTFKIYRVEQVLGHLGEPPQEQKETLLWDHHCF